MWRAARGGARGCCRATAAAGRLQPRLLLLLLLLLQAPPAAQSSKGFLRSARPRHNSLKVVGSVVFPGNYKNNNVLCTLPPGCRTLASKCYLLALKQSYSERRENCGGITTSCYNGKVETVFLSINPFLQQTLKLFSNCRESEIVNVKVYVKLNHSSPRILCVTNHLRNLELIDPTFQWNGPGGGLSSENSSVQISPTGTLILRHFNLSGVYTCSIVYKLTAMQPDRNLVIKYLIYAYSDPKNYYEFTARYHAAPCNSSHNTSFEKTLLKMLRKLVAELSCEVTLIKSECHHVKMQRGGIQNEIFFTFSVASLDREKHNRQCQQSACDASHRLNKAKHLIERFFKQQVEGRMKSSEPLPEIYYIEGTLQRVWVDRCYPGYGMNALIHPNCPECCVVCSPGSYNPSNGTHCLRCDSSLIYGATKC